MKTIKLLFILCALGSLTACLNDDHIPKQVNESEVITHVKLIFTQQDGTQSNYIYIDPKYRTENYQDPVIKLQTSTPYKVEVEFWDYSNPDDIENVTEEILDEKDDHFITYQFYQTDISLTRLDTEEATDVNGVQIGLTTAWETSLPAKGAVQVTLIHQPEVKETHPASGNHVGGETDVEVTFDLEIE